MPPNSGVEKIFDKCKPTEDELVAKNKYSQLLKEGKDKIVITEEDKRYYSSYMRKNELYENLEPRVKYEVFQLLLEERKKITGDIRQTTTGRVSTTFKMAKKSRGV